MTSSFIAATLSSLRHGRATKICKDCRSPFLFLSFSLPVVLFFCYLLTAGQPWRSPPRNRASPQRRLVLQHDLRKVPSRTSKIFSLVVVRRTPCIGSGRWATTVSYRSISGIPSGIVGGCGWFLEWILPVAIDSLRHRSALAASSGFVAGYPQVRRWWSIWCMVSALFLMLELAPVWSVMLRCADYLKL
ncbi:hypothetical protein L484_027972 [Morus notabilis]|uniref:Uncharacterized protein n=1 Tax=Morus notabilis TaxID=981085 RepID=W9SI73_9ROSA|nr:hypothetical protein L484_027972 [Morus notabilis]